MSNLPWITQDNGRLACDGRPVNLRGVNFGNWLLYEDYMWGIPGTHTQIAEALSQILSSDRARRFQRIFEETAVAEADVAKVSETGANLIRLPLNQNRFETLDRLGEYDEEAFKQVDRLVGYCRTHKVYLVLDLHAVPGGQARPSFADAATGVTLFWEIPELRDRATRFWQALARRYAGEPVIAGYELLNEPDSLVPGTGYRTGPLTEWYRKTIPAIRAIDQRHLIFIQGDDYGRYTFPGLTGDLFEDPLVLPATHSGLKVPESVTAKIDTWPCSVDGVTYDDAWVANHFDSRIGDHHGRPVYVSELNVTWRRRDARGKSLLEEAWTRFLDSRGYPWSYWSWKDFGGYDNKSHGLMCLRPDAPWRRFLARPDVAAVRERAEELLRLDWRTSDAGGGLHRLMRRHAPHLTDDRLWRSLQGMRRLAEAALIEEILQPLAAMRQDELDALAGSFSLEYCDLSPGANGFLSRVFDA